MAAGQDDGLSKSLETLISLISNMDVLPVNLLTAASRAQMLPQLGSFRQDYFSLQEEFTWRGRWAGDRFKVSGHLVQA